MEKNSTNVSFEREREKENQLAEAVNNEQLLQVQKLPAARRR